MNYRILHPNPALKPFIHHYIFVSIGIQNEWSTISLVPSGCTVVGVVVGEQSLMNKLWKEVVPTPASLLSMTGQLTCIKDWQLFGQPTVVYAVLKPCAA